MDGRYHRALHIAATTALARNDKGKWQVPCQSGTGTYTVAVTRDGAWICSCPDFEEHLDRCKHIIAVEITAQREARRRPQPYTPPETVTYSQDWPAYNSAQTNEKDMFLELLRELCSTVPQPEQHGRGQRILPMADMVFAAVFRTYTGVSTRRFASDLRAMHNAGYVSQVPHFNSVVRYLRSESLTPILTGLVELSALPLTGVESDFAVDSSGFGTSNCVSWFSTKHGRIVEERVWRKAHIMCGVTTNVVTAVTVTPSNGSDAPQLPDLCGRTAKGCTLGQVSADKAYSSKANVATVEDHGATSFIPLKSNAVEPPPGSPWARMYDRFAFDSEKFLASYHKRSKAETTFAMIKRKFGDTLAGRTDTAQDNEVLTKVIAHNLCCLVHAHYELGIDVDVAAMA